MTPFDEELPQKALEDTILKSSMCREHIKRIREKMHVDTTSDHTEYDKSKPDRTSEHDVARERHSFLGHRRSVRHATLLHGGRVFPLDALLRNICSGFELNVHEVESYLTMIEQEVEMILSMSAQYGQVMWFNSRTTSIGEELQSVDMLMEEMVQILEQCKKEILKGMREPDYPEVYTIRDDPPSPPKSLPLFSMDSVLSETYKDKSGASLAFSKYPERKLGTSPAFSHFAFREEKSGASPAFSKYMEEKLGMRRRVNRDVSEEKLGGSLAFSKFQEEKSVESPTMFNFLEEKSGMSVKEMSKFWEEKSDERSTTSESETSSSPTEGTNPQAMDF